MTRPRGWTVLGPDGEPIDARAYPTAVHALGALAAWCAQVAPDDPTLAARCQVIPPARRKEPHDARR
jgi:hypothetical protein